MAKDLKCVRVNFTLNNENYQLDKYKPNTIFLKKEVNGNYDFVAAKMVIRQKLQELLPEKYTMEETAKTKYNTRVLGAKLVKALNGKTV